MYNYNIVSENYFKYDNSDYAKSLRSRFGKDGYKKYTAKMQNTLTNPLTESKKEYIRQKEEQYKTALANLEQKRSIWNRFKNNYNSNLLAIQAQNNGISVNGAQKQMALKNSGSGAMSAYYNFSNAEADADFAFSLLNDANHSGMNFLS